MKNKGSAEQSQSAANNDIFVWHVAADCASFHDLFVRRKPTTDCSNNEASGNYLRGDKAANFAATN